jgi:hypothetical protein
MAGPQAHRAALASRNAALEARHAALEAKNLELWRCSRRPAALPY